MNSNDDAFPSGWMRSDLGEVAQIVRGITFPKDARTDGPTDGLVACLRTANVQREVEWSDIWFVPERFVRRNEQLVRPFDILISTANSLELVGKVAQVRYLPMPSTLGAFISLIRPIDGIDPRFVYFQLASTEAQSALRSAASTTTNISNISTTKLSELPIWIAPLPEQRRIVTEIEKHFTRLDAAVVALKRAQANLRRYKAAVLEAACEGRLVPQDPDDEPASELLKRVLAERQAQWDTGQRGKRYRDPAEPDAGVLGDLPPGWCWATLDQLLCFVTSGSRWWAQYYSDEGAIFIRAQDINTDSLRLEKIARVSLPEGNSEGTRTRVNQGDLLITITGANVTKTALVRQPLPEAYISQHVALVRLVNPLFGPYLYHWVISPSHGRSALESKAYGAGKPGLNLDNIRELPVGLPPAAEQNRIVVETEKRLSLVSQLDREIAASLARAALLRQSILKRAFEGELVPQDPDDESASVLLDRLRAPHSVPTRSRPTAAQG